MTWSGLPWQHSNNTFIIDLWALSYILVIQFDCSGLPFKPTFCTNNYYAVLLSFSTGITKIIDFGCGIQGYGNVTVTCKLYMSCVLMSN